GWWTRRPGFQYSPSRSGSISSNQSSSISPPSADSTGSSCFRFFAIGAFGPEPKPRATSSTSGQKGTSSSSTVPKSAAPADGGCTAENPSAVGTDAPENASPSRLYCTASSSAMMRLPNFG